MIIFINGSINSGKSTIGKLLIKSLPNTALVEFDSIRAMFEWMPLEKAISITIDLGINLIKDFVKHNMSVVVPYPTSEQGYKLITERLSDLNQKIYFFTLAPKLEEILKDRGTRKLNEWEEGRIKHHYNIGIHNPSFGIIVDNTKQTPEETVKEILTKINI